MQADIEKIALLHCQDKGVRIEPYVPPKYTTEDPGFDFTDFDIIGFTTTPVPTTTEIPTTTTEIAKEDKGDGLLTSGKIHYQEDIGRQRIWSSNIR